MKLAVIRSRIGEMELASELVRFSSVLSFAEAQALTLIDPAERLGLPPTRSGHVGLLLSSQGLPLGVCLGELVAFETWYATDIYPIPTWMASWMPSVLKPGCALDEERGLVWLLDVSELSKSGESG